MVPVEALGEECLVIAERWEWAENWAARECLRNVTTLRADDDLSRALRGKPEGLKVYVLGMLDGLPAESRALLRARGAEVVEIRG